MEYIEIDTNSVAAGNIFGAIAQRLQRTDILMDRIGNRIEYRINEAFDGEQDVIDESPWAALAPSTIENRRRRGYGAGPILQASGRGRRSIRVKVSRSQLEISYDDHMAHHQRGGDRLPKRQFAPMAEDAEKGPLADEIKTMTEEWLNPSIGGFLRGELAALPIVGQLFRS